jgi:hypothetical protein
MKPSLAISCGVPCLCWLLLCGCSTTPSVAPDRQAGVDAWSYVADLWTPPVSFSPNELSTRSWKPTPDRTVELLRQETFRLGEPEPVEILVTWFGSKGSDRTECIDFYAAFPDKDGMRYYLLCHDFRCPPYNTQVLLEHTDPRRPTFRISGDLGPRGSANNFGKWYYYELKPKWRMIRQSEFGGAASQ